MHQDSSSVVKSILLSINSVSRRIDEMALNIEQQLCEVLQTTEFALRLDELTLRDYEALLMAYVRYVRDAVSKEEMRFFVKIPTTLCYGIAMFSSIPLNLVIEISKHVYIL